MWLKRCLFRVLAKPRIKNKKDMKQQDAALVCFSGGQDSTTCLFWAKKHFSRVEAVCFIRTETFLGNRGRSKDRRGCGRTFSVIGRIAYQPVRSQLLAYECEHRDGSREAGG